MNSEGEFSYTENKFHYQGKYCKQKESKLEQKEISFAV